MLTNKLTGAGAADKTYIEDVFSTYLYTGNGSTQTINNGIDLAGKGGMVWTQSRDTDWAGYNLIHDTNRGTNNWLITNSSGASGSNSAMITAFGSSSYNIGNQGFVNALNNRYASWTFRKAPKFFDVVTYTGNGTTKQITHSLGSAPGMVIIKRTDNENNWFVWHRSLTAYNYNLFLESTSAQSNAFQALTQAPSSTTIFLADSSLVNGSGATYVAYLFAHDTSADGLIQCGSVGGGGNAVNLGWEPQYVLMKYVSGTPVGNSTDGWMIFDTMRGATTGYASGSNAQLLLANSSVAETSMLSINVNATGFTTPISTNGDQTFIYMAIRRGPMRTPTDGTKVFNPSSGSNNLGYPADMLLSAYRDGTTSNFQNRSRLTAAGLDSPGGVLVTSSTSAEQSFAMGSTYRWDSMTGFDRNWGNGWINYVFRRAPSFFDVVTYTGNSTTNRAVAHNLGVVPEMIIVKVRNDSGWDWIVYHKDFGNPTDGYHLKLNGPDAKFIAAVYFSTTVAYTKDNFYVNGNPAINASGKNYVAYLFASCPGVSKVGSYTGTGTTGNNINCGFSNGARFVLIKRTDQAGDWLVFDTARGIVVGNDPLLLINSTIAEITGTDWINPYSPGFSIASVNGDINASGGTYIYLAIA